MTADSAIRNRTRSRLFLRAVPGTGGPAARPPQILNTPILQSEYVADERAVWMYMKPPARPCFTPELLTDILAQQEAIMREPQAVDFFVVASGVPGVFNLGGDLSLFRTLSAQQDETALMRYAENCIRAIYNDLIGLDSGVITLALVKGHALGGGLEAALSCHIVVAERGVKMGFPEIMFNLFPGMGAFSLVARKVGPQIAEDLITSGRIVSSEEMHELGLVDYLAEPGKGEWVAKNVISDKSYSLNGYRAYQKAKLKSYLNVPYRELLEMTHEWVRAAFHLQPRDLKIMERLVRAQDRMIAGER